jgi:methylene-fatty-acyl-phospholipid synthase
VTSDASVASGVFIAAACLLSLERVSYVWISRKPDAFRAACQASGVSLAEDPVEAVRTLFLAFKVLQAAVFTWWCLAHGGGVLATASHDPAVIASGAVLIVVGQVLSSAVFWRLGTVGVFYGHNFGHHVPRCRAFPFSLCAHPQYFGAVLSIWGLFLLMRFPHADWMALPLLETAYYAMGAWLER